MLKSAPWYVKHGLPVVNVGRCRQLSGAQAAVKRVGGSMACQAEVVVRCAHGQHGPKVSHISGTRQLVRATVGSAGDWRRCPPEENQFAVIVAEHCPSLRPVAQVQARCAVRMSVTLGVWGGMSWGSHGEGSGGSGFRTGASETTGLQGKVRSAITVSTLTVHCGRYGARGVTDCSLNSRDCSAHAFRRCG